jgi:flagellar assembly protein FliH
MRMERRSGQMAELLKFFAEDFDAVAYSQPSAAAVPGSEPDAAPSEPAPEVQAIREAAYQEGLRDGLQQAAAGRDATAERAFAALEDCLRTAQYQAAQEVDRAATSVAPLLIQFLMKMLPAVCARFGAEEIADVARAVLPGLHQEPHVVVAVNPAVAADVEVELARLGAEMQERAVLAPTDSVPPGDVRISWRDGSAARDTNDLMQRIAAVFASHGLLDACGAERAVADAAVN